jgi:hypothetical protein
MPPRAPEPRDAPAWNILVRAFLLATGACYAAAEIWLVYASCDFHGDDILSLLLLQSKGFWAAVLTPIDVHFVPLQRVLTYAIYALAPMSFGLAVVTLALVHIAGSVYLWAILRSFGLRLGADFLTWFYVTSPLSFPLLKWWSSGAHRFPYLFCCFAAVYHYLAFRKKGSPWHLALLALFSIGAMGFYSKGFLVPVTLGAVELAVCIQRRQLLPKRAVVALLVSGALAGAVFAASRPLFPNEWGSLRLEARAVMKFMGTGVERAALGPFLPLSPLLPRKPPVGSPPLLVDDDAPLIPVAWAAWSAIVLVSCLAQWRNAAIWAIAVGLVAANAGSMAVSAKAYMLETLILLHPRFGLEVLWIPVLFGGIVLANGEGRGGPRSAAWAVVAAISFVCVWPAMAYWKIESNYTVSSTAGRTSRTYLSNVRQDLARLAPAVDSGEIGFVNALVGKPALVFRRVRTSELLSLFGVQARYGGPGPLYEIGEDGRIVEAAPNRSGRGASVPAP